MQAAVGLASRVGDVRWRRGGNDLIYVNLCGMLWRALPPTSDEDEPEASGANGDSGDEDVSEDFELGDSDYEPEVVQTRAPPVPLSVYKGAQYVPVSMFAAAGHLQKT